jgi:Flp pilus assembly pilin Flp
MGSLLLRLFTDEGGQDLVEYALLTTFVGLSAVLAFNVLQTAIGFAYGSWETGVNTIWESPDPSGAGS